MAPISQVCSEGDRRRGGGGGGSCVLSELEIVQDVNIHYPPFIHWPLGLCSSSNSQRNSLLKTFTFLPNKDSCDFEAQSTQVFTGRLKEDPGHFMGN